MRRPDLVPLLILLALVLAMAGGWLLFPWIEQIISQQDCVASGHNNCG